MAKRAGGNGIRSHVEAATQWGQQQVGE